MTPQLLKLLALNKGRGFFKAEGNSEEATVYLYDVISSDTYWGGVSPLDFAKQLASITAPVIHLRINSPGGDVFAARAMVQAMKDHTSDIHVHIDGHAASAATFLVMAADKSTISDGAMFMIHNAWTIAGGNASDFSAMADLLNRIDKTIVGDYMAKTGQEEAKIKGWMDAETYFFGQEAVDAGFVDAMAGAAPKNKIEWDLSAYSKAPPVSNEHNDDNPALPDQEVEPEQDDEQEKSENQLQQNKNRLRILQSRLEKHQTHSSQAA